MAVGVGGRMYRDRYKGCHQRGSFTGTRKDAVAAPDFAACQRCDLDSVGVITRLDDQLIDKTPCSCLMPGTVLVNLEALFPEIAVAPVTPMTS